MMRLVVLLSIVFWASLISPSNALHIPGVSQWIDKQTQWAGGQIEQGIQDIGNAPESWKRCLKDADSCAKKNIAKLLTVAIWPIVEAYRQNLFNQASGRWKALPDWVVQKMAASYPDVDLGAVRYAENIDTLFGRPLTWETSLFFTEPLDLANEDDVLTLMHELEHVGQYNRRGGYKAFIGEYIAQGFGSAIIDCRCFDPHDFMSIEEAANAKAANVWQIALHARDGDLPERYAVGNGDAEVKGHSYEFEEEAGLLFVENQCDEAVDVAVGHQLVGDNWQRDGFYHLEPGVRDTLASILDGEAIRLDLPRLLYYARSESYEWAGPERIDVGGKVLMMIRHVPHEDGHGNYLLSLSCN